MERRILTFLVYPNRVIPMEKWKYKEPMEEKLYQIPYYHNFSYEYSGFSGFSYKLNMSISNGYMIQI